MTNGLATRQPCNQACPVAWLHSAPVRFNQASKRRPGDAKPRLGNPKPRLGELQPRPWGPQA